MESLVKADIFFFITTIAVAGIAALLIVALIYVVKILKDVRYISRRLKEESDLIIDDVSNVREFLKKEGKKAGRVAEIVGSLTKVFSKQKRSRRKTSNKKQ